MAAISEKHILFNIFVTMHDNLTKRCLNLCFQGQGSYSGTANVVKCFLLCKLGRKNPSPACTLALASHRLRSIPAFHLNYASMVQVSFPKNVDTTKDDLVFMKTVISENVGNLLNV